jgi:hypothetical protein
MDPITSFVVGRIAGKTLDRFAVGFRTRVVERWSRHRAKEFFDELCAQVAALHEDGMTASLDHALNHILDDDLCSEVLFDAYRRVTLARSRTLGPRIIALLTAQLVNEQRYATDEEDAMLLAAENLTDEELFAFVTFVRAHETQVDDTSDGRLRIKWHEDEFESFAASQEFAIGPLDLNYALGRWAGKLRALGIVCDDIHEKLRNFEFDLERRVVDGSVRQLTWWIEIPRVYFRLVELVERARIRPCADDAPTY